MRYALASVLIVLAVTACAVPGGARTPPVSVSQPTASAPAATETPAPANAPLPSQTTRPAPPAATPLPRATATLAPLADGPGLVALLGEATQDPQCSGIPAFSPDGRSVALACDSIRIWDLHTGELLRTIGNPYRSSCYLAAAAFSPDSRLLVANVSWCWTDLTSTGQLLVWDVATGALLQDVAHDHAHLVDPRQEPYVLPLGSMVFLPGRSRLAYGSGNRIEIRDLPGLEQPVNLDLGPDMIASDLSVSADGQWLYVFMEWEKTNDFPSNYTTVYRAQVWDLHTLKPIRQYDYPVFKPLEKPMELVGPWVVEDDAEAGTTRATDLLSGEVHEWPFRRGWRYSSPDGRRALWFRYYGYPVAEQGIEVWETDTWRQVDVFRPDFGEDWYRLHRDVAFGPDLNLIAIPVANQLALWRLRADPAP